MESCLPLIEPCDVFSSQEWVGNRSPLCDGERCFQGDVRSKERVDQNNKKGGEAVVVCVIVQCDGGRARQPFIHNSAMLFGGCVFISELDVRHPSVTAGANIWCSSILIDNRHFPSGSVAGDLSKLSGGDFVFGEGGWRHQWWCPLWW